MSSQHVRPKWWQLYLSFPLLIALFAVDSRLKISTRGHQVVQIGIILLVYGFVHLWLKANASALSNIDRIQDHGTFTVIQIPGKDKRPMVHLPDSELKGVLRDTFEMDTIDAEFIPMDDVPQELDKE
jgi:hypothetical protein